MPPKEEKEKLVGNGSVKKKKKPRDAGAEGAPPRMAGTIAKSKKITLYKNGDIHHPGVKVVLNTRQLSNMTAFLESVNRKVDLPYGAKRLYTTNGKLIKNLDDIENDKDYVAATNVFTPLPYGKIVPGIMRWDTPSSSKKSSSPSASSSTIVRTSRSTEPRKPKENSDSVLLVKKKRAKSQAPHPAGKPPLPSANGGEPVKRKIIKTKLPTKPSEGEIVIPKNADLKRREEAEGEQPNGEKKKKKIIKKKKVLKKKDEDEEVLLSPKKLSDYGIGVGAARKSPVEEHRRETPKSHTPPSNSPKSHRSHHSSRASSKHSHRKSRSSSKSSSSGSKSSRSSSSRSSKSSKSKKSSRKSSRNTTDEDSDRSYNKSDAESGSGASIKSHISKISDRIPESALDKRHSYTIERRDSKSKHRSSDEDSKAESSGTAISESEDEEKERRKSAHHKKKHSD